MRCKAACKNLNVGDNVDSVRCRGMGGYKKINVNQI